MSAGASKRDLVEGADDADDGDDAVFKALASATRRRMLDRLRMSSCTTGELCAASAPLDRTTVLQHLRVLESAGLVTGRKIGRERHLALAPLPIKRLHDRWIGAYMRAAVELLNTLDTSQVGRIPQENGDMETHTILLVGFDPTTVPGVDAGLVLTAIELGRRAIEAAGVDADECLLPYDADDMDSRLIAALRARNYECVVIGGGIRKPEELLELFERLVNLIRLHAPQAAIAFNRNPTDSMEAALRAIAVGHSSSQSENG